MRFAFMILVHHQPKMLVRLIDRLDHADIKFFIHVDAKTDIVPFVEAFINHSKVTLLPKSKRASINWGGFGIINATLALMSAAYEAGADRFVLLSGADYPVRPLDEILAEVAKDQEILAVDRLCDRNGRGWFDKVAYQRYVGYIPWLNPRTGQENLVRLADRIVSRLPRRRSRTPIYYGPAWYSLTRAAVGEVLAFAAERPKALQWFFHARSPDEMLIQTILKQSSRAGAITMDSTIPGGKKPPEDLAATHYANFEPGSSAPRVLDLTDLPKIEQVGALFARKVDPEISAGFLEAIDKRHFQSITLAKRC